MANVDDEIRCPFYTECNLEKMPYWCESDMKYMSCIEYQKRKVIREFKETGKPSCPRCGRYLFHLKGKFKCQICGVAFPEEI
jgi:hypothetical protein